MPFGAISKRDFPQETVRQLAKSIKSSRRSKGASATSVVSVRKNSRRKPKQSLKKRVSILEKEVKVNQKYSINVWASSAAVPTTPVFTYSPTYNIVQGDTDTTRDGNKIYLTSYNLKYLISTNTNIGGFYRIMVVLDKDTSEAAPTTGALFQTFTAGDPFCWYNANYLGKRFKILYDKIHVLGFDDTTNHVAAGPQELVFEVKIPVKGIVTTYSSNSGTIASAATNHLFVLAYYSSTASAVHSIQDRLSFTG